MSAIDKLVDNLVGQLQVPQKIYDPPKWEKPDLSQYPVDYLYSGRLLLSLGDTFKDHKIEDNMSDFSFYSAVSYCINSKVLWSNTWVIKYDEQEFCQRIGINVIVIGPDPNKYRMILCNNGINNGTNNGIDAPFVIIFHSLEDMYYPIVTLERRESNIHYRQSSSILQKLIVE